MTPRAQAGQMKRVVPMRLPRDLVERIDQFMADRNKKCPGLALKRSDAIRILLYKGLDAAAEGDHS